MFGLGYFFIISCTNLKKYAILIFKGELQIKYELPRNIKRQSFGCSKIEYVSNYSNCQNCRVAKDKKECWAKHLLEDLQMDCDINNEQKAENYVKCSKCKSERIVGCAFNNYMCSSCGYVFSMSKEEQKNVLGEHYEEIDMDEFNSKIENV